MGAELQNSKFDAAIKTSSLSHKPGESKESERTNNLDVGAELQNSKFDAAIKTSRLSRKHKKNLQILVPKRRKEETNVSSNVTHSENVRKKLYENVKSISESQERLAEVDKMSLNESYEAGESERTNNLDVGAELQNSKFDAAIKTSRLSRKHKKNLQIPVPTRRIVEISVNSNFTNSGNVRKKLYENVKSISESQERLAEVDKIRIMQVNAHGALTSTKLSYLKEVIRLHRPEIILVNEFGQPRDLPVFPKIETFQAKIYTIYRSPRRHKENVKLREQKLLCPNITLIEEMVEDLSKLLLKSEQEAVPKVKIKMKLKITASYVILEK